MIKRFDCTWFNIRYLKAFGCIGLLLSAIFTTAFSVSREDVLDSKTNLPVLVKKDSLASVAAFRQVYAVLMSPRCMNCHPSGDVPLQGEDSHLHVLTPKRGVDGRGLLPMKCTNCHQAANTPGLHAPPGNPNWHLPPANMRMVFQGRTPNQLAKQLVDTSLNGHKDLKQLIEHADDDLVKGSWNPGVGRKLPPISHAQFKKAWITWLTTGAYAPLDK